MILCPSGVEVENPLTAKLRVERVDEGTEWIFRMLGDKCPGCLTHYRKGLGSQYCDKKCPGQPRHKEPHTWKGYIAAQWWCDHVNAWVPCCLEVSERLEHDLRPVLARGQIWKISRAKLTGKKKAPVVGELLESRDPEKWPEAFALEACLYNVYHCKVVLDVKNPIPLRPIEAGSPGDPPSVVIEKRAEQAPLSDEEETIRQRRLILLRRGDLPRGRYTELDAIIDAERAAARLQHTNGNGRSS